MDDNEQFWYAARTRAKHEIVIRDFLRKINTKCYLPTVLETRRCARYRTKKVEIPVISNLIFIKLPKEEIISILNEYGLKFTLIRDTAQNPIRIPEKQMEDFIRMIDMMKEEINTDLSGYRVGDRVRILEGLLAGVEGELIKVNGRHHVMIQIRGIVSVSVQMPKRNLEKIVQKK